MSYVASFDLKNDAIYESHASLPSNYMSVLENFDQSVHITIQSSTPEQLTFDLVGADASISNALRRIMISEVPTMAIETVYISANSSVIHDEVLSHRLGLIPIYADPSQFDYYHGDDDRPTDLNTIVFKLDVTNQLNTTQHVYSNELQWIPQGRQASKFMSSSMIRPVHADVLIVKLSPGQSISLEAHCRKGIGSDHAKYSPVATATYRMLPEVSCIHELNDSGEIDAIVNICPMKVFEKTGGGKLKVSRPRDCTLCRECIRHFSSAVSVSLKGDHFIFSVESTGCLSPADIVRQAIKILGGKAKKFSDIVGSSANRSDW